MKSKKQKNYLIFTILFILILAIIYFFNHSANNYSQINTEEQTDNTNHENIAPNGNLFYAKFIEGNTEIYRLFSDESENILYKDDEENEKIKYILGYTDDNYIVVYIDENNTGNVYKIKNNEKMKLDFSHAVYQKPVISNDLSKIAYIIFSNVEFDYGFKLFISDNNGKNILKINTFDTPISDYSFNSSSSQIAYINSNNVYVYDLITGINQVILTFEKNINSAYIYWDSPNNILLTAHLTDSKGSIIYNVNVNQKKLDKITSFDKPIKDKAIWASSDYESFFYISEDGSIMLFNKNNNKNIDNIKADTLIKWQP